MINTSCYKNFQTELYRSCSISSDGGRNFGYKGDVYLPLVPKGDFLKVWEDNKGKISEEENTRYYIEEYYKEVLSKLDPQKVYRDLRYSTILCYENPGEFCHRHVVSSWLNLLLGNTIQPVTEIIWQNENITKIDDCSSKYNEILEDVIRNNEKMCGFTSVRARYLFDCGEKLEALADKSEEENPDKCYDSLRQAACYLRCDADEAEAEYKAKQKMKAKGVSSND